MLDLRLFKGPRFAASGILDVGMHYKDTSQAVPLCCSSWHHRSIHVMWPHSRCLHYMQCTSSIPSYRHAIFKLISKISVTSPNHPSLAGLYSMLQHGTVVRNGNGKLSSQQRCSRIIMPFHPGLHRLNRIVRSFHSEFESLSWHNHLPVVTWRLGAPSIYRRLLRDSRIKLSSGR